MTAATTSACPKCNAANPSGAKFCAGCRNPLAAAATPAPAQPSIQPPVPPPITPMQGFLSSGGKAVTQNVAGNADAVHAHLLKTLEARKDTDVEQSTTPGLIVASAGFKDWLTTGGVMTRARTEIRVSPIGEQQSQVSVQASIDSNTTSKVWGTMVVIWVLAIWRLGIASLVPVFGLAAFALTYWLLQTEPVEKISDELFQGLRDNAERLGQGSPAAATASVAAAAHHQPTAPSSNTSTSTSTTSTNSSPSPAAAPAGTPASPTTPPNARENSEEEVFEQIAKLAKLKEMGAISETEFETKKTELLARI